ncbi:hypothetical protein RhiirA1_448314 [Rhizophagus irregularis]|nr:hypothetical protein RhiirA1_448314 [Rhizophagus irregularis]GET63784.1 hypothetical protein GLOIN_2v136994 [Rhizophagus irregularis DAOM 181602=DAOM 197198]UZO11803.1 hypothetical protein OCT59_003359 [Rhizophagus irregularis]CAB4485855.1 unnamed protein product [Rhizophagus irregularis]CAB5203534.1 unnamed protein product [Rhizophagus irregularis]
MAILDTRSKKYHDILKLLADENCLVYNYALSEIIHLIEDLVHPNERIEDKNVIEFALKTANHLSDYKWTHYNGSTIVQLELFLKAIETIYNVVNSEYLSALSSVTNFEYSAGIWYDDWKEMHEIYFKLHQQSLENNLQLDSIKKFIRKLIKLSTKEFERVKRKNTKYRNLEYKVLKTGG